MIEPTEVAPRVRLAADVDLSVAKRHGRCNGTGIIAYQEIDDPTSERGRRRVPVICRCVTVRGGVKTDIFDQMAGDLQRQQQDGSFSKQLVSDIRLLPPSEAAMVIESLTKRSTDPGVDQVARQQVIQALEILKQEA